MSADAAPAAAAAEPADDIVGLRTHLFEALRAVRAGTLALDQARMVNELARTLIDTARAETEHARVTETSTTTGFIGHAADAEGGNGAVNGIVSVRRHLIR